MSRRTAPDHVVVDGKQLKHTVSKNLVILNFTYTIVLVGFVYFCISTALPISLVCVSVMLLGGIKYLLDRLFVRTCFVVGVMNALIQRTLV